MIQYGLFILMVLNLLLPLNCFAGYDSDANCQGFFPMEDSGNETDEGANTNNTLTEEYQYGTGIPQSTDRQFGSYSRDFENGDAEALEHADGLETDINGADQNVSLCGWIKAESSAAWRTLAGKGRAYLDSSGQYRLNYANGDATKHPYATVYSDGSNGATATGATNVDDGSWHHLAVVYNDTDIRLYVDGSLDSNGSDNPKTYSNGIANEGAQFAIGSTVEEDGSKHNRTDGLIDDVAVFDRELTSTEVTDIYDNGIVAGGAIAAAGQVMKLRLF